MPHIVEDVLGFHFVDTSRCAVLAIGVLVNGTCANHDKGHDSHQDANDNVAVSICHVNPAASVCLAVWWRWRWW